MEVNAVNENDVLGTKETGIRALRAFRVLRALKTMSAISGDSIFLPLSATGNSITLICKNSSANNLTPKKIPQEYLKN